MNYYELLGISSNATLDEIKNAYKTQMKKWHPDINKDEKAVSMSMKINEAKDILLDDVKRKEYDLYLKQKESDLYKKYSNSKSTSDVSDYEQHMVTKWEYFKEYLNSKNIKFVNKIISIILVSLETLFCFILKWFVIGLAFISFTLSDIILMLFYYALPIIGLLLVLVIYKIMSSGYASSLVELRGLIILVIVYFSSYLFVYIGKRLISQKVFNLLYNKIDIYLFKKAVFYK